MSTVSRSNEFIKHVAKCVWFRRGSTRASVAGPYSGLRFEISPALKSRMSVFLRSYEPEVTGMLSRMVKPGMIVYDIGAHVGIHTLYIGRLLHGRGAVFAFEPWPDNLKGLLRNLEHNPSLLPNVVPVALAVGAHTGLTRIARGSTDGRHHLCETGEHGDITVGLTTLDEFVRSGNPPPALIKIDIEGHEDAALSGAERLLHEVRPAFLLEHHGAVRRLVERLASAGYETCSAGPRHLYASHGMRHQHALLSKGINGISL